MRGFNPRVKPERGTYEVDRDHPLARGLVESWLFDEGGGAPVGLLGRTVGTNLFRSPQGIRFTATGNALLTRAAVESYPLSLFCRFNANALHQGTLLAICSSTDNDKWAARINTMANGTLYMDSNNNPATPSGYTFAQSGNYAVGSLLSICGTFDTANRRLYSQGRLLASATTNVPFPISQNRTALGQLVRPTLADPFSGEVQDALIYNRALSASEIAWLHSEPYAMLRPSRRVVYSVPDAAVATFKSAWARRPQNLGMGTLT